MLKKITGILVCLEKIKSFASINVIPFKIVSIRYYKLMPTLFPISKTLLELSQQSVFNLIYSCKTMTLRGSLFLATEKVAWGHIWHYRGWGLFSLAKNSQPSKEV